METMQMQMLEQAQENENEINQLKSQQDAALAEVEAEKAKLSEALAAREVQIAHL